MEQSKVGSRLHSTKLYNPPLSEDFISLQRLQKRLDLIANIPLTLVSAPAGSGKTTALSAWLEKTNLYGAWLSLDEYDNDLTLFLAYLIAAIQRKVPTFGKEMESMQESGVPPSVQTFIEYFLHELDAVDRGIILVLDDFHVIHNPDILGLIRELIRHPHPQFHLVLLTRHDPQLPMSQWRARHKMIDVRSADLRFNREETAAFLQAASGRQLDSEIISNLYRTTEGWIAGLRLAVHSMAVAKEDVESYLVRLSANNQHTIEYLAEQVLDGLPANHRTFLIQTSILDQLSGSLCEAVVALPTGALDGQATLRKLYEENLFIVPLDNEQRWFRYHHLFGEFLRSYLVRECSPEEIANLHLRASRWFAEAGFIEEAIRHAITAGEMDEAIKVVTSKRTDLFNRELFGRLSSLLNLFPAEVVNRSPEMLLTQAWDIHTLRYDLAEIIPMVDKIDTLINTLDLEPERLRVLRAENDLLRGIVAVYRLDLSTAMELFKDALEVLPKSYYIIRSFAWIYSGASLQLMGDMNGAQAIGRLSRREDLAYPEQARARSSAALAYAYWMSADLVSLEEVSNYMMALTLPTDQFVSTTWGHYFLASVHYHRNELADARHHAEKAFEGRYSHRGFFIIYVGIILALTYQASGDLDKVRETMHLTNAYAIDLRSEPLIAVVQAFQVELDIRQGRLKRAAQWAEQMLSHIQFGPMPLFYAPQLTIPKALLGANDRANARLVADILQRLRDHVESIHNTRFLIEVLALDAMFHDSQGDEAAAFASLERSLALAEPSDFIRLYVDLGPRMKELLGRLRAHNARTDYVRRILDAFPGARPTANEAMVEPLTERELQVLDLLARRLSNKEIAQQLVIAPVTVKRHTINIYQKLNVDSRREAVLAAQRFGIIDKPPAA